MPVLVTPLRRQLEAAIGAARQVAEAGAHKALEALAVSAARAPEGLPEQQRALRRRLRAHARQLGDARDGQSEAQGIVRLVREVAYEHWHRMLFARFLAETGLLIEPTHKVALSLGECMDLAREQGVDPWQLAAGFAEGMLPGIFRPDDPALAVTLPPETRQELERLLAALPSAVFTSDDALGWTYQFWQAAEKDVVNERVKSGEKITGETLPAVTQLFTEHYMVLFLLHNTLGAWHAGKVLSASPELAHEATSEDQLRRRVALPGCEWEYLRFVREPREGDEADGPTGPWRPASGVFATWPRRASELTVLDPCCGSGHFLVAAFDILVRLRMSEEGLGLEAAIRVVLAENLCGLELDPRCTQIAAFNLAHAAWRWLGSPIELPGIQVACSGLGPAASKEEWLQLAEAAAADGGIPAKGDLLGKEESLLSAKLRAGCEALYDLFDRAPDLGSLIDPTALPSPLYTADYVALQPLLRRILATQDVEAHERAVAAAGMAQAARILVGPEGGYALVLTNVPYLGRRSHTAEFKEWVDANYPDAKTDLATVMFSRTLRFAGTKGTVAAVVPQNGLFLTGYRAWRQALLRQRTWRCIARLGPGAFETVGGHVVNVALLIISGDPPSEGSRIAGIGVVAASPAAAKATSLRGDRLRAVRPGGLTGEEVESRTRAGDAVPRLGGGDASDALPVLGAIDSTPSGAVSVVSQAAQLDNPDSRIMLGTSPGEDLLSAVADFGKGSTTGDAPRYLLGFWELGPSAAGLPRWLDTPTSPELWSGRHSVLTVHLDDDELNAQHGCWLRGQSLWGRTGIVVNKMAGLESFLYAGEVFDDNVGVLAPHRLAVAPAILAYCESGEYREAVRRVDQALKVTAATLVKVPFDEEHWLRIAAEQRPHGLPEPQSNDPTQWLFHGHPAGMLAAGPAARSAFGLGDRAGVDRHPSLICRRANGHDLLQVAVARLLGFRWPVEDDDSVRLDVAGSDWVARCRELDHLADCDGVLCIPSVHGDLAAADRLRVYLTAALVDIPGGFTAARERQILVAATTDREPVESLEEWLRDRFFEEHNTLFQQRPFIWHIWDGVKDGGFSALVNYHRLAAPGDAGRRLLESLIFTYLGEWIDRQKAEHREGRAGSDRRYFAATALQEQLKRILEGEPPYDLFIRWRPLHAQPLGWEPNLDDGVRLNIRPFLLAEGSGRDGAGLLRVRPKSLKWEMDRGKEPQSLRPRADFPWFWGCHPDTNPAHVTNFGAPLPGADIVPAAHDFDGKRWNNLHYTRAAKEAARAAARQRSSA